jgi:hypothetical protein
MEKKYVIETIKDLAIGQDPVGSPMFDIVACDADELNDEEIDIVLIRNMRGLSEHSCFGTLDESWRWQTGVISRGKYPLKKLPLHVREIARELYYNKKTPAD